MQLNCLITPQQQHVIDSLESLVEKGALTYVDNGKQRIYVPQQSGAEQLSDEVCSNHDICGSSVAMCVSHSLETVNALC